jgi:hypothetical protein
LSFGRDLRDWFLDRFELAEGLWYRSVVNYDWNESVKSSLGLVRERLPSVVAGQLRHAISDRWDSFFGKGTALLAWATGIAACIALLLWVRRYYLNWKITRSPKDFDQVRRAALLRELKRMQKQMARAQNSVSKCPTKNLLDPQRSQNWNLFQKVYVQFRFGPEIQSLAQLRKAVLELERIRIAFVQEQRRG